MFTFHFYKIAYSEMLGMPDHHASAAMSFFAPSWHDGISQCHYALRFWVMQKYESFSKPNNYLYCFLLKQERFFVLTNFMWQERCHLSDIS